MNGCACPPRPNQPRTPSTDIIMFLRSVGAIYDSIKGYGTATLFAASHMVAIGAFGLLARAPAAPSPWVLAAIMAGVAPSYYIPSAESERLTLQLLCTDFG